MKILLFALLVLWLSSCEGQNIDTNVSKESNSSSSTGDSATCPEGNVPVCWEVQVQCIKAPCDPMKQVFSNECEAKKAWAKILNTWPCMQDKKWCSSEYDPLCAKKDWVTKTYSNPCTAVLDQAEELYKGECKKEDWTACAKDFSPVCAYKDWNYTSYLNACFAKANWAEIRDQSECQKDAEAKENQWTWKVAICTAEYDPVCWQKNWASKTYSNSCNANNDWAQDLVKWECKAQTWTWK